jgi:CheY-like chemotaxis protein
MQRSAGVAILVVEDEAIVALDLRATLAELGYQVTGVAPSGEVALKLAVEQRPALVLMDIMLAGPDSGVGVAEELYVCHGIPVVFASAYADPETVDRARRAGAYGFVPKPYSPAALRTAIEMALAKHEELRRTSRLAEVHRETLEHVAVPILTTDADLRVSYMNPAAEALLGMARVRAMSRPVHEVLGVPVAATSPVLAGAGASAGRPCLLSLDLATGIDSAPCRVTVTQAPARADEPALLVWTIRRVGDAGRGRTGE